jgi:hypothetical protein
VFGNRALGRIFSVNIKVVTGGWRKLHNANFIGVPKGRTGKDMQHA